MQTKRILIAGIVLILVVVATIITVGLMPRDKDNNIVSPAWVVAVEEQRVAKIEVTNTHGSYTATFDNGVNVEGLAGYPLSDSVKGNMRAAAGSVHAYDTVERSVSEPSKYGFANPTATATVTDIEGKTTHITVGSEMPNGTAYYVMNDSSNHVYAVESDYLLYVLADKESFLSKQITSIPADTAYMVDYVKITKQGQPYLHIVSMEEDEPVHYNANHLYKMIYPYQGLGRDVNIVSYLETACNLTATTIQHLGIDTQSLAEYGLAQPPIVVEYLYSGQVTRLYCSEPVNGFCNIYVENGNIIYSVLAQKLKLMNFDALDFVTPYQFERDINEVERILIQTKTESFTYHVKVENGNTTASLDNTPLNSDAFERFYDLLTTSELIGVADKPSGSPTLTMTFRYHAATGMKNDTVTFTYIDERTYFIEINGQGNFYVSSLYVDKVLECIPKLNSGQDFNTKY